MRTTFQTSESAPAVVAHVATVLGRDGWAQRDLIVTPGQGPIPHWSKKVGRNEFADAFVFDTPQGSGNWYLSASWQPPGAFSSGDCA